MKRRSTDARIILAHLRETWLRDQQHATFTKLIRRSPPNQADNRGGHDATLRVQIISAIADGKAEAGTPSSSGSGHSVTRAPVRSEVRKFCISVISAMFDRSASQSHA
jgi:hypothetical protein